MYLKMMKKAGAAVLSAALALNGVAASAVTNFTAVAADSIKVEFEDTTLSSTIETEADSSASGGSVAYMKGDGSIEAEFEVSEAGMYDITIYAHGVGGSKQQDLYINGVSQGSLSIPESDSFEPISTSIKLSAGKNTLSIRASWGWSKFDYFTVASTVLPDITASQTSPCDPKATPEAKALMNYLSSVYGSHIISGQQEIYMYGHGGNFEQEFTYLQDTTGKLPAIRGFDFLNEANILGYGTEDGTTDRIIKWVTNNPYVDAPGIATASWHLTVPKNFANYKVGDNVSYNDATYSCSWDDAKTKNTATDFNTANVIVEGTKENEYYMAALEELASYLTRLQDANVPLIFRPLHEAEGGGGETGSWFWWGAAGSDVYKQIWRLTYDTLTEKYGIHNLIWEWNSYNYDTSMNWYPGDEYVDIVGYDKYNCVKYLAENNWQASYEHDDSAIAPTFYGILEKTNGAKMIAMAENDCFSTVGNLTGDKAGWLYFCTWYDGGGQTDFLSDPLFNTKEDTIEMYNSEYCLTLDEMPADLYSYEEDPNATTTTKVTTTTTTTTKDPNVTTTTTAYKFAIQKQTVAMEEGEKDTIVIKLSGAAGASIGGGIGFQVDDPENNNWKNIKWSGNADSDGNLEVTVDVSEIPAEDTSAEVQVWWSNTWDASAEKSIDQPYEIVSCTVNMKGESKVLYGDATGDGQVLMNDVVLMMQAIANKDKYGVGGDDENALKEENLVNADCCNPGDGLTVKDAQAVQKLLLDLIEALPEVTTAE